MLLLLLLLILLLLRGVEHVSLLVLDGSEEIYQRFLLLWRGRLSRCWLYLFRRWLRKRLLVLCRHRRCRGNHVAGVVSRYPTTVLLRLLRGEVLAPVYIEVGIVEIFLERARQRRWGVLN